MLIGQMCCANQISTGDFSAEAIAKLEKLKGLVKKAKKQGIQTIREETAIRTAEIFLEYAKWDESHQ